MTTQTKTAHTAGPWAIEKEGPWAVGHDIYSCLPVSELLASVYPMKHDNLHDSWKANARLIAAAPEMLEALMDAASLLPVADKLHPSDLYRLQMRVTQAIQKALGGQ